jgi:type IV pilus assembly protein PilC
MDVGGKKLNKKAFLLMCSQFAIILSAGIPISRCVQLIAAKISDKRLNKTLLKVAGDVEAGRSISASFAERGGDFLPGEFIETISAGEQSGNLSNAFRTVYEHFDKQTKTAGKVRSALAYPAFVLVIAVLVVAVLMIKVVPAMTAVFDNYGASLPGVTRALIAVSNFFTRYWLFLAVLIIAVVIIFKLYEKTESGKLKMAKLRLKLPLLGNIATLGSASEFSNTLAMMLSSGLPLTRAISITARTLSNYYMSTETGKLAVKLEEGRSLGASMREAAFLPDILVDMVAVGEETGEMESTLNTVATYYDSELEVAIASALAKLEPALLVFLAAIAGFIVIAIYSAMFGMYGAM